MSDEVISIAARLTALQALTFILYEMSMQNYYVFMAGGDTRSIAIMDSCMVWFVQIPILYVCANYLNFGIEAVFLGSQSAELIKLFLSTALMKKERWLNPLAVQSVIESS
jgi:Na+-driven multidrug efflux pump